MQPILVSVVCSAAVSAAVSLSLLPLLQPAVAPQQTAERPPRFAVERAVAQLRAELRSEAALASPARAMPRTEVVAPPLAVEAAADAAVMPSAPEAPASAQALATELLDLGLGAAAGRALWQELAEQGRLDEVLDVFRLAAETDPRSPEAQWDLARAVHDAAVTDPGKAPVAWWTESDEAYAKVLELDPRHWDARYEKAVNLTFWPAAHGRMPEAIAHFEALIDQGAGRGHEPRQAKAFFWLGNLHAQRGAVDAARSVWSRGLQQHPSDDSLRQRLAQLDR